MKKILFALFAISTVALFASDSRSEIAKKLYGRIRIVTAGEDYSVRVVGAGEDLAVRVVGCAPTSAGQWEFVTAGEDFEIRFVEAGEDISVRFVGAGEGPR